VYGCCSFDEYLAMPIEHKRLEERKRKEQKQKEKTLQPRSGSNSPLQLVLPNSTFSSRSLSYSITHSSLSSKVTTLASRYQKASTTWVKQAGLRQEYIMIERESRAFTCHKVIKQRTTCFLFLFL